MQPGKLNGETLGKFQDAASDVRAPQSQISPTGPVISFVEKRRQARRREQPASPEHPPQLDDYEPLVSRAEIDQIRLLAEGLRGKSMKIVSSSVLENEAAELVNRVLALLREVEITADWELLSDSPRLRGANRAIRQALTGEGHQFNAEARSILLETQEFHAKNVSLDGDVIVAHDPEALGLIQSRRRSEQRWVWRCHLDLSNPAAEVWAWLKPLMEAYDAAIFSTQSFAPQLAMRQYIFYPCIDPLSEKNKQLEPRYIQQVCDTFGVDRTRPVLTQISPFTRDTDPLGVIEAYRMAKKYVDCQLVLAGQAAQDDPDSANLLAAVKEAAAADADIVVADLPLSSAAEINALQSASSIILQKSLREGFGTTVTEALWKGKPVIGTTAGGIRNQIIHKFTGMLVHSVEGCAYQIRYLLTHPGSAEQLGRNGREHVKENFLVTADLKRWLLLLHILLRIAQS